MPSPKPYNPADPTPYEAPTMPELTPPAPPPIDTAPTPPSPRGMPSVGGQVAFYLDNALKGFMRGKSIADAQKVMKAKKQTDDLSGLYNDSAKRLMEMKQAGVDENSAEWKRAKGQVDASWGALMQYYGQHIAPEQQGSGSGGKKKGKLAQAGSNLLDMFRSKDPAQVSAAWYQLAQKAGPPVYYQLAGANAPTATADREFKQSSAQVEATRANSMKELQSLHLQDTSKMSQEELTKREARIEALQKVVGAGTPGLGGIKLFAPKYGHVVTGADLMKQYPNGVAGPNGVNFIPTDKDTYQPITYGEKDGEPLIRYMPVSVSGQLKTTPDPKTGLPQYRVFNPTTKSWEEQGDLGQAVVKGEVKSVPRYDEHGNLVGMELTPVVPPYLPPGGHAASPSAKEGEKGGNAPTSGVGPHATSGGKGVSPLSEASAISPHLTPAGGDRRKAERVPLSPFQTDAADHAIQQGSKLQLNKPKFFEKYDKAVQGKLMAIRGQEQTLNGIPGTKDIGLRQATSDLMTEIEKNPQIAKDVAVAIQAADQQAKSGLTGKSEGDYGWLKYMEENWNSVPAMQAAFAPLKNVPAATNWMDYFFRAWTNAATLRALQGSSGKPSQSMYAILVNELPRIGGNVWTRDQAMHKIDLMEAEVKQAEQTLPAALKKTLDKEMSPTGDDKKADDNKVNEFLKKHGIGQKKAAE